MSRGPGRIECAIRELLDAHRDLAFVTDDLVRHCYPGITTIERKHQVSVLRAAHKVIANDRDWQIWGMPIAQGHGAVFFNHGNVKSYISGREACIDYVSPKRAARANRPPRRRMTVRKPRPPIDLGAAEHERTKRFLAESRARDEQRRIERDARWTREVHWHCARRDGFTILADALQDRLVADLAAGPFKRCPADSGNGKATLTVSLDPTALADRIRALAVQNDPDVLREGLAALAAELDAPRGAL
jgi:hypothetical protein